MKTTAASAAAVVFCSGVCCQAFVPARHHDAVLAMTTHRHTSPSASPRPTLLPPPPTTFSRESGRSSMKCIGGGVRRTRSRNGIMSVNMSSSFDPSQGDSAAARAVPVGPGAGVIDLKFESLKTGGFKVFLLFFLLGQGRAKDNDAPFSVRETSEGIRVLIGDETKDNSQWDGVLDISWGVEPRPFFRVDRIDVNEVIPYPGELYILNKLLDAIIDVNGEQSVADHRKLFTFRDGEQHQLAEAKATLAGLATLG